MGRILIIAGGVLCVSGIIAVILAVMFFGKQRTRLLNKINDEYREA